MHKLSITLESYLDTINEIWQECHTVRSKDIAARLSVRPATVTSALRALASMGYIEYEPYREIKLTEYGKNHANGVLHKHEIIASFYTKILGIDQKTANEEACKAEHIFSEEIIKKLDWLIQLDSLGAKSTVSKQCTHATKKIGVQQNSCKKRVGGKQ